MSPDARVYVAGHTGLVGSAIVRRLERGGYRRIVTRPRATLDLRRQSDVEALFAAEQPEFVILAAARVGGILANDSFRYDFICDNLQIQTNIINAAFHSGVQRLLFMGSSCIYPRDCPQPMREEYLLTGSLESTNEPYAIAKIAGLKMCEALNAQHGTKYLSVMPTNLYGPNDNYDPETSHVMPALIRKFSEAKERGDASVTLWGTGQPLREFLHVDDLADACVFLLEQTDEVRLTNVGTGKEISIRSLAKMIADIVEFEGDIVLDLDKPDGTPRKLLDVSLLRELGWMARMDLRKSLGDLLRRQRKTAQWSPSDKYRNT